MPRIADIFLREKTHRVLTWQGRVVVLLVLLIIAGFSWPLFRIGITHYIYRVDEPHPDSRIVVENWNGDVEMFEGSKRASRLVGAREIWSIIYEDAYADLRKRRAVILNAWAAGIDTSSFHLIPVIQQEPKTLHIARAVADTAHRNGWQHITIVTEDLHSSRSRKAYNFEAKPFGISVTTLGVSLDGVTADNWPTTSTGLSSAFSEMIKKIYYDLVVF